MRNLIITLLISAAIFLFTVNSVLFWLKKLLQLGDVFAHHFKYSLVLGMFIVSATFLCAIVYSFFKKAVAFILD